MAYGVPWSDRDYEPDPREIVEEAARAAGMTVSEWLNRASYDQYAYRGARPTRQQRRYESRYTRERSSGRDTAHREDRISRILDGAMENIEDSLRSNEERTASALEALEHRLRDMERAENRQPQTQQHRPSGAKAHDSSDLVRTLESKISNVVNLLESRSAQHPVPRPQQAALSQEVIANVVRQELQQELRQSGGIFDSSTQTERLKSVEESIHQLNSRLAAALAKPDTFPKTAFASAIEEMQQAVRGLQNNHQQDEILGSIRQLENRLAASESQRIAATVNDRGDTLAQPLSRIYEELNRITQRTKGLDHLKPVDSGLSAIERQMGSISDRIDALTEKVASSRLNGPRDLRVQKPVDTAFEELKALIMSSQAPATDSRVLNSLQVLERKVEAMERGPGELATRLDRIQTMIGEKPTVQLPKNLEPLLQNIVSRLDQVQNSPADDKAFDRLHQEIRQLSQKIAEAPHAQQMPVGADISGVERHLTQLFQQMDSLKENMGEVALQAASKAAADTLSQHKPAAQIIRPDTSQFERALSTMQMSQQEGERRTHMTLEAVHSTLQKVVDRLVDMERDMQSQAAAARLAPAPVVPTPPLVAAQAMVAAPSMVAGPAFVTASDYAAAAAHQPAPNALPDFVQTAPQAFAPVAMPAPQPSMQPSIPLSPPPVARPATMSRARPLQDYTQDGDMPALAAHQAPMPVRKPDPQPVQHAGPVPVFDPSILPQAINTADQSFVRSAEDFRPGREFGAQPLATEGLAALDDRTPDYATAPAKGGIAGVIAAARNAVTSLKKGKTAEDDAGYPPQSADNVTSGAKASSPGPLLDMPLEPGSGRPAPEHLTASRLQDAPLVAPSADPKAAFLAAARRAAQAAAEQSAEVLAQDQKKGMPSLSKVLAGAKAGGKPASAKADTAKAGLTKKHAILLGLAALIVAVGAAMQFTGFKQQATAPVKDVPERSSSLNPAPQSAPVAAPVTTASVQQPRQILPGPATEALPAPLETTRREPPPSSASARDLAAREKAARDFIARTQERVAPTITQAASPSAAFGPLDPVSVGSINPPAASAARPSEAARTDLAPQSAALPAVIPSANDPLFRFDGLRGGERLKQAAKAGDPNAFLELGNRYADGRGAPRDPKIAAQWYERAAEFGSAPAQYRLASMYREGRGLERNPKTALKHFQAAADAGNARAMHNTAVLLAEGVNGSPDYAGAADWFRKAAENGIKDSQYNLAILNARGLGTPQDLMASYAWFAAAGAHGDEDAVKKRDEVGTRLSPEKLEQAKAAAATWKARTPDPAANEAIAPAGGWDDQAKSVPPAAKPKTPRG